METNEIKKALYKQKPIANRLHIIDKVHCYKTYLANGTAVAFEVPESDMGEAKFESQMDAKLLIRWMLI